jgi:hypothetical protein
MKYVCNMRHVFFIKSVHISSSDLCFTVKKFEVGDTHRIDRVLEFFSSRPKLGPHPPPPHPLVPERGEGHNRLREWGGGSQFGRGDRHCGTLPLVFLYYVRGGDYRQYIQAVLYVNITENFFYNAQNFFQSLT